MKILNWGRYFPGRPLSVGAACKILPDEQRFLQDDVERELGVKTGVAAKVFYKPDTLRLCVEANKKGNKWTLFFKPGISGKVLRELHPAEFCDSAAWESGLFQDPSDPGYRLINLRPRHYTDHRKMCGRTAAPCRVSTIMALLIAARRIENRRLLQGGMCLCEPVNDQCPYIGNYDEMGMLVSTIPKDLVDLHCSRFKCLFCLMPETYKRS